MGHLCFPALSFAWMLSIITGILNRFFGRAAMQSKGLRGKFEGRRKWQEATAVLTGQADFLAHQCRTFGDTGAACSTATPALNQFAGSSRDSVLVAVRNQARADSVIESSGLFTGNW